MSMTKLVCGLAALPLIAGVASAAPIQQNDKASVKQPVQLSEQQMDKVTAGWDLRETDISNTSQVFVSIYERRTTTIASGGAATYATGNNISCAATNPPCYLSFSNPAFSIASAFYKP